MSIRKTIITERFVWYDRKDKSMFIKEMFEKQIDRDIQGVIIVGQSEEENVAQELDEYVVTRELQKHFAEFFSAYKKGIVGNTPKMGVWISGFFGSGKSHFLKILSYLLANKSVGDRKAIDFFADDRLAGGKPKIVDQMVLADMKLAADTSTDVVLFNIDSKSDSNSKQNKDAIVNVFLRVFNEMQGFCGAMPFLADLERRLTEEGRFAEFKEKFEEVYGDAWEDSRQDFDFIQDDVVDVLTAMDFMSEAAARNWCEKASEPYQISIEDFAKRVKAFIERKGNNHHVVFLVDEIGQYIGEDSKLMLNLQTVTEELGKECMENVEEILRFALEMRRRVKEQQKKIGGMEFYDVNFSYIDNDTFSEEYVPVLEQGGSKLIPEGMSKPGHVYTVGHSKSGMLGIYKLEMQMTAGNGKFEKTGLGTDREAKEAVDTAYRYLKANARGISGSISMTTKDYIFDVQDMNGIGMTKNLSLASVVAICSIALAKPVVSSAVVLGDFSIGGTVMKVEELANTLQVCLDSGAKKVLLPIASAVDLGTVPAELIGCFNLIFYNSVEDAVFKALGVE